ncbi:SRPBCC domain-containing protein [Frankia sp. Mgl5]|nr:SRPBCC domain-containing protein [Frankia sp. Mgl5]
MRTPRPAVYRALVDPGAIARWRVPAGMTGRVDEVDAREGGEGGEGGSFRISLSYDSTAGSGKTTARTDTYRSRFLRLVPDVEVVEELVFETADAALRGVMTMTTTLADADGGGTDVTIRHEGIPDGVPAADNEAGTRMALAGLAAFLEAGRPAG